MFSTSYTKPGVYFKISDVPAPITAIGDFIPIFIGLGRKELDVFDTLTRGSGDKDLLTDSEIVVKILSIVDENNVSYEENKDFKLERTDAKYEINWKQTQYIKGTVEETYNITSNVNDKLKININGTSYTITFDAGNNQTAQDIVDDINDNGHGGATGLAEADSGYVLSLIHI